jgi:NADPH2:quinone reductase
MRAIRVTENGGPEVLKLDEVPRPKPKPGEALVAIEAAGLNFIDVYVRTGAYKSALPLTPGSEGAGTVVEVGEGVTAVKEGDRVGSVSFAGSYAELALAPAERLVPLPDPVTARQAAAALLQGITAHYLAVSTHELGPGQTCVVHAAAGGVGLLLCQIAKRRGARVIGTVSTEEKARRAREAGADVVVDYTKEDFAQAARRETNGAGVNVVYDSVGKTTFERSLDALAPRGTMVLFGQSSGAVPPLDPQVLNRKGSLYLTRPTIAHYTATKDELLWRAGEVLSWVADQTLRVRIDREVPLADAALAHEALESRATSGKVLLIP